jgi:hypothetical protein
MAVYKIFPTSDTSIYSVYPAMNTGLDEILEATVTSEGLLDSNPQSSRILIQFSQNEISDILTNKIGVSSWTSNLRLFIANAEGITGTTTLECYPISGSWEMGTGKYNDNPLVTNGAGWTYRTTSGSTPWATSSFSPFVTASWYSTTYGGGTWYTGSSISGLNIKTSQSYSYYDDKDLNLNVTDVIKAWISGAFSNNGFLIKQEQEFSSTINTSLKYFSRDTHTIYPPQLEFKWNDSVYNTGSLTVLNTVPAFVSIDQNSGTFYPNSINIFRVNSRPEYPIRTWQTSSLYTTNNALPEASYYAVKDLDTDEYVIDFDTTYTKLSCDSEGSFFKLYMNGLEPERYYKILIQTTVKGNTIIFDDNYMFKIVNG